MRTLNWLVFRRKQRNNIHKLSKKALISLVTDLSKENNELNELISFEDRVADSYERYR